MPNSAQLTAACNNNHNPVEYERKLWEKTRYLVAQKPASANSEVTKDGYYKGCHVIPGPLADEELQPKLKVQDWGIIKNEYFIRFVDGKTTSNADAQIGRANYTIMDTSQADDYEAALRKLNKNANKS